MVLSHRQSLRHITDIRDYQLRSFIDLQTKLSVDISYGSVGRSILYDVSTDNSLPLYVGYGTFYRNLFLLYKLIYRSCLNFRFADHYLPVANIIFQVRTEKNLFKNLFYRLIIYIYAYAVRQIEVRIVNKNKLTILFNPLHNTFQRLVFHGNGEIGLFCISQFTIVGIRIAVKC